MGSQAASGHNSLPARHAYLRIPAGPLFSCLSVVVAVSIVLCLSLLSDRHETSAATFVLSPTDDAYVAGAQPNNNFGLAPVLLSDTSPLFESYLKFDLGPLAGQAVSVATLRMFATDGSNSAHNVKNVASNTWTEGGLTYSNRPAKGTTVTTFNPGATAGVWREADVTSTVAAKAGLFMSLAIDAAASDGFDFSSAEAAANRVELVVQSTGATLSPTSTATSNPTPTAISAPTPGPANGKGIALRPFAEYWGSDTVAMNSDFADMNAGNITWARIDLYKTDSPDPHFDAAIQGAQSHSISVLVVVHKTPPSNDLGTDGDRAVYRTWLAEMVNRYKHYVKYWEIQNEPNLHYEWNINESSGSNQAQYDASVRRYVAHLQDGFETVKANDPSATVLFGGLSEWTVERYMDVLFSTEAHQYFDIMAFHPYGSNPDQVLSRFDAFKARMSSHPAYAAKPIWVNELGFNTTWSNLPGKVSSEQQKADYLVQSMSRLYAAGAQLPVFWYTLHENENASGFGLTLKDKATLQTQYYPAFYAYRDLALGPAPTSTPTATATPAPTPTPPTPSPSATPTPSPTSTASPTPTPSATATPTATASPTFTPSPTDTPSPTPTQTSTPTPTASSAPTDTPSPTPTSTTSPTETPSPTTSPTPTAAETPTPTAETPKPSPTPTPTPTSTALPSPADTASPTLTPSPTDTPTPTETPTPPPTESPTETPTPAPVPDTDGDTIPDDVDQDDDNDGFTDATETLSTGTGPLDPCGHDGWPADLAGNDNTLNIGDFNSFQLPLRGDGSFNKMGHLVPDPDDLSIARWDLQPNNVINIGDLNAINPGVEAPTARPPMFGGQPAFFTNGGQCPFPP